MREALYQLLEIERQARNAGYTASVVPNGRGWYTVRVGTGAEAKEFGTWEAWVNSRGSPRDTPDLARLSRLYHRARYGRTRPRP